MLVIEGPKEWTQTVKCHRCTATLEVGMDDITLGEFDGSYCESGETYVCVGCCVCGTWLRIDKVHSAPILVAKRARENYQVKKNAS